MNLTVDAGAHEPLLAQVIDDLLVLALAPLHDRGEEHEPGALGQGQDLVHHLAHGLGREHRAVGGAVWLAGAGVEESQIIVYLGGGPDRGAGVVGGGLLLDGDRRRQPFDGIDIRFLHHRQELPRIGRQGLDIAALALGIDGIEGERGLPRAGQPGDDDEPVPRQVEVDVLEIVGPGTPDADGVHGAQAGNLEYKGAEY